jgi:hypothetical protein
MSDATEPKLGGIGRWLLRDLPYAAMLVLAVGVFLALSVPAVAWVQESAMLLLVGALLLILVGAAFWWMWRRESRL